MKETIRSKISKTQNLLLQNKYLQNNLSYRISGEREVLGLLILKTQKAWYASYAYAHTYDIGNYYKVNDAFEFESSVDDLQ